MKAKFLVLLMLSGFIPGAISISAGGDTPGFKVYSGAGNHETGDFTPASDGEVTIISQPEVQEKSPAKQESEKPPEKKAIEIKNTIIINENKENNQNYWLPYRRYRRHSERPKVEHYSKRPELEHYSNDRR